jgi:uncharacterized membrane protein required for colicin V production
MAIRAFLAATFVAVVCLGSLGRAARQQRHTEDAAPTTSAFLVLVGLLTLTTAAFGALLVVNVLRWRDRLFR